MKIKHIIYKTDGTIEEKIYNNFQDSQEGFTKTFQSLEVKDIKIKFMGDKDV